MPGRRVDAVGERRLLEYRARRSREFLFVISWTTANRVRDLESNLIEQYDSRKSENTHAHSTGPLHGPWHCVYVAWTPKNSARLDDLGVYEVSRLSRDTEVCPTPLLMLWTDLDGAEAQREVLRRR